MIKEIKRVVTVLMAVTWIIIAGSFIILFVETPKKLFKKIKKRGGPISDAPLNFRDFVAK